MASERFKPRFNEEKTDLIDEWDEDIIPESGADTSRRPDAARNGYHKQADAPISPRKKSVSDIVVSAALLCMLIASVFIFTSGARLAEGNGAVQTKDLYSDIHSLAMDIQSDAVSDIYKLPKVYTLPWNEDPAPKPDPAGFRTVTSGSDTYEVYSDETITVTYHCEKRDGTIIHLADVKIAHPSQLRTAFAGGKYGTDIRYNPSIIAEDANALIATNADFYNYRETGYIIRNGTRYRMLEYDKFSWDVLFIDDNGDFHIVKDRNVKKSGVLENYNIVNSLHFGPSLVVDGKINIMSPASGCGNEWNFEKVSPRTAIGQIGPLHYLMCVVEGRSSRSIGLTVFSETKFDMADLMLEKGCQQAYSLDGGKSATMIFGGKTMNDVLWGGERVVSDIVYFATAIPNE